MRTFRFILLILVTLAAIGAAAQSVPDVRLLCPRQIQLR